MGDQGLVVVTGAAGGIGAACVETLARSGHDVIGVDMAPSSPAGEHVVIDLSTESCGDELAEIVGDRPLAGLVNNAALAVYETIEETSIDTWNAVLDTNLRAPFLLTKALLPNLTACAGSVVNVASVHAFATSVGIAAYAAAKGGLVALTRAMAVEFAGEGVRVNAVIPGAVSTQMLRGGLSRSGVSLEQLGARHPLGRVSEPAEVAEAIVFLVDGGPSAITGSTLTVDGGALARLSTE
jgi:glucose 1-dehydrogenase